MADPPPYPDTGDDTGGDTGARPDRGSTTHAPRWVKLSGIVVVGLVLLFVILHITGNSLGGPGSHTLPEGGRR